MGGEFRSHLSSRDVKHIARAVHTANFSQGRKVGVNPIFVSNDQEKDPRVESFRQALHSHYDGVVMSTELPPARSFRREEPMGTRKSLIPDAVPQRQKSFQLQDERLEAHNSVTQDWAEYWFIERPPRGSKMDWASVTFVVPKMSLENGGGLSK